MVRFSLLTKSFLWAALTTMTVSSVQAQSTDTTGKMDWWHKARFGMFIHWGVYAVPAGVYDDKDIPGLGEWIMQDAHIPKKEYAAYAQHFNPQQYDPEKWVLMAKQAGMKYIVITAKHHDGFALFDTKASDWNIVKATPYGKDLLKPFAEACRKHGMKLGFYYSQANDWYNPGGAAAFGRWDDAQKGSMDDYIKNVAVPQVKELLTNYGDVVELWWDVPTDMNQERAAELEAALKLQPRIITNDRLGGDVKGDISTPEQYIPATGIPGRNWETCMTINNTWGYKSNDQDWKSSESLIRNLVDITSKGGNYLLNVGPDANGVFPKPIVERLHDIGEWMAVNQESIYGTTASPFKRLPWGRCTQKQENGHTILYLHVFRWPYDKELFIPGLKSTVGKASLLANHQAIRCKQEAYGVRLYLPAQEPDPNVTVLKLELTSPLVVETYPVKAAANGNFDLGAALADIHDAPGNATPAIEHDEPNIGYWTDANDAISWKIDVQKAGTYAVTSTFATASRGSAFTIELGDQQLKTELPGTGDYDRYKTVDNGSLTISKPGVYTIYVKPVPGNWHPINLRRLELTYKEQ